MCLMLCAPLDWQYAELPSSASDAVLCSVLVRKMFNNKNKKDKNTLRHFMFGVEQTQLPHTATYTHKHANSSKRYVTARKENIYSLQNKWHIKSL